MLKKSFLHHWFAILILSFILVWIFQGYSYFFGSSDNSSQAMSQVYLENKQKFQSAYVSNYAAVGVALSTRIGIAFSEKGSGYSGGWHYRQVVNLWNTKSEKKAVRKNLISQNMILVREYLNLSKSNIVDLLKTSDNRRKTLEGFINQLQYRKKNATLSIQSLESQKEELLKKLSAISAQIEATKKQMEKHFSENNPAATNTDVDTYFALRADYTETFTDIVFINQFLKQYSFLNSYNAGILNTLVTNKEAIINQTYVVIPESWSEYLKPLELIFSESELKNAQKTSD